MTESQTNPIDIPIDIKESSAFLDELAKLTNKYGIAIGGCGCCGSPYLYRARPGKYEASAGNMIEILTFVSDTND